MNECWSRRVSLHAGGHANEATARSSTLSSPHASLNSLAFSSIEVTSFILWQRARGRWADVSIGVWGIVTQQRQ